MRNQLILASLALAATAFAQELSLASITLHESISSVRTKLQEKATFQREEEGQQIWKMHAGSVDTVIVGFDAEGEVRYITALPVSGSTVSCDLLGPTPKVQGKSPDHIYERQLRAGDHDILVIARGPDPQHLLSCSLKDPAARMQDPDEEDHPHKPPNPPQP